MSFRKRIPCSNSPEKGAAGSSGFTLLEVMIAVALIAIALVTLIGAQGQSVAIATGSRFDVIASLLAQWKLTDLHLQDGGQLASEAGRFGEEYPAFFWKTEVRELTEQETGIKGAEGLLKLVELTVATDQEPDRRYTLRTIVAKKPETVRQP